MQRLVPREGKVKQTLCSDWLPQCARWVLLAHWYFSFGARKRGYFVRLKKIHLIMTAKVRWLGWILAYHPDLTIG